MLNKLVSQSNNYWNTGIWSDKQKPELLEYNQQHYTCKKNIGVYLWVCMWVTDRGRERGRERAEVILEATMKIREHDKMGRVSLV